MIFKLLILVAVMLPSCVRAQMLLPIVSVYDGDTIKTYLPLPHSLSKVSIRIYGIDTPEIPAKSYETTGKLNRAKCVQEAENGLKAKQVVADLAAGASYMIVDPVKWDRNGGRIVGIVTINGINIANELLSIGLAVKYYGYGPKQDWCQ